MTNRQLRNAFITINYDFENQVDIDNNINKDIIELEKLPYRYIIIGKHTGLESKIQHIHTLIEFKDREYFQTIKNAVPRARIERRKGKPIDCKNYINKENNILFEDGTMPKQGKRNDLDTIAEEIKDGASILDIFENHGGSYIRYHNGIEKARGLMLTKNAKKFRKLHVKVLYGRTDVGKTRTAFSELGEDVYKLDVANNVWFDGYDGQKNLIIDDFYGWIKFGHLLNILDGYMLRIEIKGGFSYALWENVIITSNRKPTDWYPNINAIQQKALLRRIHETIEMK